MANRPGIMLPRYAILLVLAAAAAVYLNILGNGLVWDDSDFIRVWPGIRHVDVVSYFKGDLPAGHGGVYRPVRSMLWGIGYAVWGGDPFWYHMQSILLHVFVTYGVYLLVRRLFHDPVLAIGSAFLFAVHPVHTESIAFITSSYDQYCVLFYLLSVVLFLKGKQDGKPWASWLSAGLAVLAVLTDEMGLTLPGAIFLAWYATTPRRSPKDCLRVLWPYMTVILSYAVLRFGVVHQGVRGWGSPGLAVVLRLMTAKGFFHYISVLFFPWTLNTVYLVTRGDMTEVAGSLKMADILNYADWKMFVANTTAFLSAWTTIRFGKKHPPVAVGAVWFYLTMLPVMNIIPVATSISERYLYLPSVGWAILAAYLFMVWRAAWAFSGREKRMVPAIVFALVIVVFSVRTVARNFDWKDDITLWGTTVVDSPGSSIAFNNLGKAYGERKEYGAAEKAFRRSIELNPKNWRAQANLGNVLLTGKRMDEAETVLTEVIRHSGDNITPVADLARIYLQTGRVSKAAELLEQKAPEYRSPDLYILLGTVHLNAGKWKDAETAYGSALGIDPDNTVAANNLSGLYLRNGTPDRAAKLLDAILPLSPSDADLWFTRGTAYAAMGDKKRALEAMEKSFALSPSNAARTAIEDLSGVRVP